MNKLKIDIPDDFVRGGLIASRTSAAIDALAEIFPACWDAVRALRRRFGPDQAISLLVEIWPDTGRVFWIAKVPRELFRLEVACDAVEQEYFRIRNSPDFDAEYAGLMNTIRRAVRDGRAAWPDNVSEIVIRDSDDVETEESLFKDDSAS